MVLNPFIYFLCRTAAAAVDCVGICGRGLSFFLMRQRGRLAVVVTPAAAALCLFILLIGCDVYVCLKSATLIAKPYPTFLLLLMVTKL